MLAWPFVVLPAVSDKYRRCVCGAGSTSPETVRKGKSLAMEGTNAKRMRKHYTGVAPVLNLCVSRSADRKIGRSTLSW